MTRVVFVGSCEGRRDMGMDDSLQGMLMGKWEVRRGHVRAGKSRGQPLGQFQVAQRKVLLGCCDLCASGGPSRCSAQQKGCGPADDSS